MKTNIDLGTLDADTLVRRYPAIGIEQSEAIERGQNARFNRLYDEKAAIETELKFRPGDQRRLLLQFYGHDNMQVRLNAAHATLSIASDEAIAELQRIKATQRYPQAADAGLSLQYIDEGRFVPD